MPAELFLAILMFHLTVVPVDASARSLLAHNAQTGRARRGGVPMKTKATMRPENDLYGKSDLVVRHVWSKLILADILPRAEPITSRGPLSHGYDLAIKVMGIIQKRSGTIAFSMNPRWSPDHVQNSITRSCGEEWPWSGRCDGIDVVNVQLLSDGCIIIQTKGGPVIIDGDDAVWDVAVSRKINPSCL